MELKKQVATGAIWVFMDQFGVQLVSFVVNLVLARLLMPADFGTIALFNVVINICSVLINGGMSSSLVRTQSVDERDLSTVFWFNMATTALLYLLVFIAAPWIGQFYQLPILSPIIRVYSIVLIIDSFVHVQAVLFDKKLDFKTTFKVRLPSVIVGGVAGIGFALAGMGVWSLVYSALLQNLLYTLQYWFYSDWRPTFTFDRDKFNTHFAFGIRLTLSALLNVIFNNVYSIVIGKRFSETTLGYYNRAESLKNLPINNISTALNKVTYPLFAKFSNDDQQLRHAYRRVLKLVIFIIAPTISLMVIAAEPIIRLLLGAKWLPAVPYFQLMALGALFQPIHNYNLNVLQVKGRSDLYLKLEIIKKICIVIAVVVGLRYGIFGLIWGQVAVSVASLFINTHYTARFLDYSMRQQLSDLLPSIFVSCALGCAVWWGTALLPYELTDGMEAFLLFSSYIVAFATVCWLIQLEEYRFFCGILRSVWKKRIKI
ncbi:O-antigen/teichoic acid export membrane protein [Sphingobacterium zeae]|uniref:O-antigen/teichoic acid export membrane protein n=1 Tax=Sphingobacterium zeae TaxID=1776859 RepID=A0ABU0U1Q4_9SPHI|nr:lipopolysaccharide biosynthesis protein [Sphingobacterium zeae]MDQ1148183.1 O-antigen/teichoic acid export membrane protein [Sphingobacterium zeae]